MPTGLELWKYNIKEKISDVALSKEGNDIVVASEYNISFFNKNGEPRWKYKTNRKMVCIDISGNGNPELCTGGRDGVLRLYDANQPEAMFLAQRNLEGSILSIQIEDANNDGQMEIVVGRSISIGEVAGTAGTLQVFRYAPSGQIELLAEHPVDRFVTTVRVTDVTGDEKNEILAGGSDSTLRILKMGPENTLTEYIRHQLDDMPIAIGTCDVIGDEIEEIVIARQIYRPYELANQQINGRQASFPGTK